MPLEQKRPLVARQPTPGTQTLPAPHAGPPSHPQRLVARHWFAMLGLQSLATLQPQLPLTHSGPFTSPAQRRVQAPQLFGSLRISTSHPLKGSWSQLAKPE